MSRGAQSSFSKVDFLSDVCNDNTQTYQPKKKFIFLFILLKDVRETIKILQEQGSRNEPTYENLFFKEVPKWQKRKQRRRKQPRRKLQRRKNRAASSLRKV